MRQLTTNSEQETRAVARALVSELDAGSVLLLSGDLGAGKTAFVKGLAEGLGVDSGDVTSPTFTLVHEYRGGRLPLVHVDLYRLETADLDDLGLDTDLAGQGVVAVEWPERLTVPPADAITVQIVDAGESARQITIERTHRGRDHSIR
jgi:tRNA threonylcarbamoyladenosine biosynthesis protein TsaE